MLLSDRINSIEPSLTRKLFNMAQNFDDVIDLTLGDPDLIPNPIIREAACNAIEKGNTRYSANAGLIELREVIANYVSNQYKTDVNAKDNITVTVGGMEALYLILSVLVNPGDEVIIPAPYYVNYYQMVLLCGGKPILVNTKEENNFNFTINDIANVLSNKTVAIILNTPSNPTGQILDKKLLDKIENFITENEIIAICDEVYSSLLYDNQSFFSLFGRAYIKNNVILIDSISKRFSMTGYRLGYAVGPKNIISAMTLMQENVAACAPLPSQYAAIAAYNKCLNDTTLRDTFEKRRNYIYKAINDIDGLSAIKPAATFYLFVNIKKCKMDSISFAESLLKHKHVAVVPGITYGQEYDNYVRIAFTTDIKYLKIAVDRIKDFIKSLNI